MDQTRVGTPAPEPDLAEEIIGDLANGAAHFVLASDIAAHEAHRMPSECTGQPSEYPGPPPMKAIEEYQRSQLAQISDPEIESAEHAERNTMRLEWYVEKKAAEWIVETLKMLPL